METEPLQDTLPPRHAIESDESEDEGIYPPAGVKRNTPKPDPKIVVDWHGPQERRQSLLVALDEAGRQWAKGVKLGEAKGKVLIDDIEVASAFRPSWAEITIVLTNVRLPVYTIHAFASMVITTIRPTSVAVIDAYPVPSYISSLPHSPHPPIRFLRTTAAANEAPPRGVEPFQPPNLVQSPAAAFLSILESSAHSLSATLFLLPATHIPSPASRDLNKRSGPDIQEDWEPYILSEIHKAACGVIGTDSPWSNEDATERPARGKASRRGDIGEGGMYI